MLAPNGCGLFVTRYLPGAGRFHDVSRKRPVLFVRSIFPLFRRSPLGTRVVVQSPGRRERTHTTTSCSRVCKTGAHLFGRRYEVEAFEEARPDAFCSRCSRWGHIAPHCSETPRCAISAKDHTTHDHQGSVEGCKARRGHGCTHTTTQCANCKGPHRARADACAAKKE